MMGESSSCMGSLPNEDLRRGQDVFPVSSESNLPVSDCGPSYECGSIAMRSISPTQPPGPSGGPTSRYPEVSPNRRTHPPHIQTHQAGRHGHSATEQGREAGVDLPAPPTDAGASFLSGAS